jgi:hypothetical protein
MSATLDLGRRIELVSMDPHFRDITIGLYERNRDVQPEYLAHSYSSFAGTRERVEFVIRAMEVLGALDRVDGWLRFSCGARHQLGVGRVFL